MDDLRRFAVKDDDAMAAVAVVCERGGPAAEKVTDYLKAHDLRTAEWFPPEDMDDVDEAVTEGRFRRVIFPDLPTLFDAIWDQEMQFDQWLSAGTTVSFVDGPNGEATAVVVFESWREWNQRRRRRQIVAGVILSVVAIVAGFLFTLSVP
jgi:hypothetical protein